ncbi:hypothetical protein [Microbacterium flavescens]|uniref:hypothetical protein n=1 Tax=Microbacterium flavescens TaxID=69366 RepID=UPI001BDED0C8|nr:hypothetical protein [Microbacterium flavescens]
MKISVKLSEGIDASAAARPGRLRGRARSNGVLGVAVAALAVLMSIGLTAPAAAAAEPVGDDAYDLTVNGQKVTLDEGETVTFSMQAVKPKRGSGAISPQAVYTGNGGTITVNASNGVYYWFVSAPCATSFFGSFSITDLTTGLFGGGNPAVGFSGSAPTSKLNGHRYSGTLSGSASNIWGVPCAVTGPNNTLYTYRR